MPLQNITTLPLEHSVPNEVLFEIFNNLPVSNLATLTSVSHGFNAVAEHILYSSISIRDILSTSSPFPCRTKRCCQSIMQRAHLGKSIRGFHIRWQIDVHTSSSCNFDLGPTLLKLERVLRSGILSSIESLELWLGPVNRVFHSSIPHTIERIIYGSHFPQLTSCSLGAEWAKGLPSYSDVLDNFLGSLQLLRHLKLHDHHATLNLSPVALPILSSFRGSPATSASLLPGRPIQYLSLIGDDYDVNQEILTRFAKTTVPLRFLDLSGMSVRPILLRNLAAYLPAIEILKVRLALRHTLHYALTGIRLLTGLSSVLSTYHQLVHLDLSPTSVAGGDAEQELSLCNEWYCACPSLNRITFPSHTDWFLDSEGLWICRA
ncbi:hypothetical protein GGU11DRAFT_684811 [Lentinula aff. detonsa]|uniref:F-box domain-containing protein n=1 Tax=Lentinula aff. detonsa TaxID=2804958 RepID=A0AA38U641_9AGAR|nr:hypothetical protein GGU10DRAFT_26632 [Lentinula aff. detonsa]KAJ3796934.1 hypothetical protein GGU11DRAFT_684811 [Lentinula aff. detonsa]